MPDVVIEKQVTLDLLDIPTPALSSTNDLPKVETKPDAVPDKPAESVKTEEVPAAEEKAEESATPDKPDDPSAEPEPKKAKGVQKRIDELTRQREDERRRAEAAEARLDRALNALGPKDTKTEVDEGPQKPVKDPNNPEAYDAALEQYVTEQAGYIAEKKVKEKLAEEEQKRADTQLAEQTKQVQETYRTRVEKAKEKYADYSDVAESPDVQVSIAMASAIAHSEDGPDIAYFLGKDFQNGGREAERISKLVPQLQLVELGKISAKLASPAPTKPVSAAPKPGTPIKASSETKLTPEEEPMETYAARRKKELAERGRPGVRH